jgi:uncharacterized peroxidase-related enzyme
MAWIKIIDEADAEGRLIEAYRAAGARGKVANILKVHGVSPDALTAHLTLYRTLMFGESELSRAEREAIAVAVSAANGCHY